MRLRVSISGSFLRVRQDPLRADFGRSLSPLDLGEDGSEFGGAVLYRSDGHPDELAGTADVNYLFCCFL